MKAKDIAAKAAELVGGDRERQHGATLENHAKIAAVWNGILKAAGKHVEVDAHLVACMMEGLKIARRFSGSLNEDDYTDAAGYAAVAGEIAAEQERINKSRSMQSIWTPGGKPDEAIQGQAPSSAEYAKLVQK